MKSTESTEMHSPTSATPPSQDEKSSVAADGVALDANEGTTAADDKPGALTRTATTTTQSSAGQPGEDDESKYIKGAPLYLLTFGLSIATFCIALDNTILATAIPRITTVFNSLNDVGWYGSSYLLTTTSLQPSFGKIYIYFNVKWTYIIALLIFEVGSIICGAAVNSTMLIVGRAIAGVGAAALFSGGMNIIAHSVPLRKRPIFIGLLSSMFGISSIIGPILGGAFTDRVSWRWWYVSIYTHQYSLTDFCSASTSTFPLAPLQSSLCFSSSPILSGRRQICPSKKRLSKSIWLVPSS